MSDKYIDNNWKAEHWNLWRIGRGSEVQGRHRCQTQPGSSVDIWWCYVNVMYIWWCYMLYKWRIYDVYMMQGKHHCQLDNLFFSSFENFGCWNDLEKQGQDNWKHVDKATLIDRLATVVRSYNWLYRHGGWKIPFIGSKGCRRCEMVARVTSIVQKVQFSYFSNVSDSNPVAMWQTNKGFLKKSSLFSYC